MLTFWIVLYVGVFAVAVVDATVEEIAVATTLVAVAVLVIVADAPPPKELAVWFPL